MATVRTYNLTSDGWLQILETDDTKVPPLPLRSWTLAPAQIAAHRKDPAFDAALPAPIKATLDAPAPS